MTGIQSGPALRLKGGQVDVNSEWSAFLSESWKRNMGRRVGGKGYTGHRLDTAESRGAGVVVWGSGEAAWAEREPVSSEVPPRLEVRMPRSR